MPSFSHHWRRGLLASPAGCRRRSRQQRARGGFTLVELLIVVAITLAITAIALPVLVPSREERRILEGARLLTTTAAHARGKAVQNGRPAGLTLRRVPDSNTGNYSTELSISEIPPPYSGGVLNAVARVENEPWTDSNMDGNIDAGEFTDWNDDGVYSRGLITGIGVYSSPTTFVDDTSWQGLVRPNDQIKLNFQGHVYRITTETSNVDTATGAIVALNNTGLPWTLYSETTFRPVPVGAHSFQIRRGPVPSAAETIELPQTMCVDLTGSSVDGTLLSASVGEITILFTPGGAVDSLRFGSGTFYRPTGPIFLLLGKTERVGGLVGGQPGEPVFNWLDTQNARWVMINQQTGLVTSNPPATTTATDVATQLNESRALAREAQKIGDR